MASPCDSDTDAVPSPSSSGEYYIPGSRLIRYKSRRGGDFDPLAYHVADPATKTNTVKKAAAELSERPVSAKGQAAGAEQKAAQELQDKSPSGCKVQMPSNKKPRWLQRRKDKCTMNFNKHI